MATYVYIIEKTCTNKVNISFHEPLKCHQFSWLTFASIYNSTCKINICKCVILCSFSPLSAKLSHKWIFPNIRYYILHECMVWHDQSKNQKCFIT